MKTKNISYVAICLLSLTAVSLLGCNSRQSRSSSSLSSYLSKDLKNKKIKRQTPHIDIPARVGVAFIPEAKNNCKSSSLSDAHFQGLMDIVIKKFDDLDMIESITPIPSTYLTPGGGFANLEQLAALHDIDIMVLLSYDQVQHTDANILSLTYWTIIGAYLLPGDINSTSTIVDAAVFHIPSRSFLFRAPGTSNLKGLSAAMYSDLNKRSRSLKGFNLATKMLSDNLSKELDRFKKVVKSKPKKYKMKYSQEYQKNHAGSSDVMLLFIVLGLAVVGLVYLREEKSKGNAHAL